MTQEHIQSVLKEIYSRVPKEWRKNVVTSRPANPIIVKVVEEALSTPEFPEEKKKQLQDLKDAGYFSKEQLTEDPVVVKKIDNFVNREIKKAVKEGRLPGKKKLEELKQLWKEQKDNSLKNS